MCRDVIEKIRFGACERVLLKSWFWSNRENRFGITDGCAVFAEEEKEGKEERSGGTKRFCSTLKLDNQPVLDCAQLAAAKADCMRAIFEVHDISIFDFWGWRMHLSGFSHIGTRLD